MDLGNRLEELGILHGKQMYIFLGLLPIFILKGVAVLRTALLSSLIFTLIGDLQSCIALFQPGHILMLCLLHRLFPIIFKVLFPKTFKIEYYKKGIPQQETKHSLPTKLHFKMRKCQLK